MKNIDLHCKCGCGDSFSITFRIEDDKDYAIISTLTAGFYAHQLGFWDRIKRRIHAAWFMLRGKEYYLHEVILTKEQWNEFVEEIKESSDNN